MNSYFASVEQQANPFLRGRPVGICAYLNDHGCVIASSIEAKRHGVTTGMRVPEARRVCPEIVLVQNDPRKYRSTTRRIFRILSDYTDELEPYSIDEAFFKSEVGSQKLEVGKLEEMQKEAKEIKHRIKQEVGEWLKCSIGIAPTRWLAKVGSDFQKPDGLTVVSTDRLSQMYAQMKLTDAWGIGDRIALRLNRLGITTLNQLRAYPVANLMEVFGSYGYILWSQVNGIEVESLKDEVRSEQPKSIGHSYCLPREAQGPTQARRVLMKLCEKTGRRLRVDGRNAWALAVAWSSSSGGGSRHKRLQRPLWDSAEIFKESLELIGDSLNGRITFLAVSVGDLNPKSAQLSLFDTPCGGERLVQALDSINDRYGEYSIIRGSMWATGDVAHDRIGFRKTVSWQ